MGKKNTDIKPKANKKETVAKVETPSKTKKTTTKVEIVSEEKKTKQNRQTKENKKQKNKDTEVELEKEEYDPNVLEDHEEKVALESIDQKFQNCFKNSEKELALNSTQVTKAIKCIKEIISKRYENTLNILSCEDEELIYMNFVLGKLPLKYSLRPVNVPLEKTMHTLDQNTRICLFVKDPKQDFKDLLIDFPIKVKVIDVASLKLKYSRFQDRRNLLKQFDLFLCDYKIYFVLKKLLGKPFYVNRKYPVPIKINYEDKEQIKTEVINHVNNSGVFYMTNGPNYAFKVAKFNMDKDDILKNIMKSVHYVVAHIMKWGVNFEDLKSITLKGANTLELPIFNQLTKEEIMAYESK